MNVQQSGTQPAAPDTSRVAGSPPRTVDRRLHADGERPTAPASRDVELSAPAREFVKLRGRLDAVAVPDRPARIARLRAEVLAGVYAPDAASIAAAITRDPSASSLLGLDTAR